MTNDTESTATKGDLLQLKDELTNKMEKMHSELLARMEDMVDQMNRGFAATVESIRSDTAHVDEVAALDTRLTRVEQQLGIGE